MKDILQIEDQNDMTGPRVVLPRYKMAGSRSWPVGTIDRCIEPEWLDELPAHHPDATRSRRDLVKLNAWMRNPQLIARALRELPLIKSNQRVIDLGAGDGQLLLKVAEKSASSWPGARVLMIDKTPCVSQPMRDAFNKLGWTAEVRQADLLRLPDEPAEPRWGVAIANLVLHHFSDRDLVKLFRSLAARTQCLVALEPRRSWRALFFSRLVWFLGCNKVTRHDAPASVRAGFKGKELSNLWPRDEVWHLREGSAGLFGHLFVAVKASRP